MRYWVGMITATPSSSGHCLCRNVGYRFEGPRTWACFCHCEECRRNCAAPIVAYIGVPLDGFLWQVGEQEGTEPAFYPSSQGVKRFFCNQCGTPMAFQAEHYPGEIHLYAATLKKSWRFRAHLSCALPGKAIMASFGRFTPSLSWECSCWSGPTHLAANLHLC